MYKQCSASVGGIQVRFPIFKVGDVFQIGTATCPSDWRTSTALVETTMGWQRRLASGEGWERLFQLAIQRLGLLQTETDDTELPLVLDAMDYIAKRVALDTIPPERRRILGLAGYLEMSHCGGSSLSGTEIGIGGAMRLLHSPLNTGFARSFP